MAGVIDDLFGDESGDESLDDLRREIQEDDRQSEAAHRAREQACSLEAEASARCRRDKDEVEKMLAAMSRANSLVGNSPAMLRIYPHILRVARSDNSLNVFIYGETGAGKEVLTKLLAAVNRTTDHLEKVDVSSLSSNLGRGMLFGVAGDVATGVSESRGFVELAGQGTLMFDGLEDIGEDILVRMKRLLDPEVREYQREGEARTRKAQCRFICCSNIPLAVLQQRNGVVYNFVSRWPVQISLPSLNERRDDIPVLVRERVRQYLSERGYDMSLLGRLSPPEEKLMEWRGRNWEAGNVRALLNAVDEHLYQVGAQGLLGTTDAGASAAMENATHSLPHADAPQVPHVPSRRRGGRRVALTDEKLLEMLLWADDEERALRFSETKLWRKLRDEAGQITCNNCKSLSQRVRRIEDPDLRQRAQVIVKRLFTNIG